MNSTLNNSETYINIQYYEYKVVLLISSICNKYSFRTKELLPSCPTLSHITYS